MEKLLKLAPLSLGKSAATSAGLSATHDPARGRWLVRWPDASGRSVQAECAAGQATWSKPVPVPNGAAVTSTPAMPLPAGKFPDNLLAWQEHAAGRVAVRSGRRVVGHPPRFPSASLVICREEAGAWRDLGFADEVPELLIGTVALAVAPDFYLVAYLVPGERDGGVCRVVELPRHSPAVSSPAWGQLPPYPQAPGMAGLMIGMDHGVLIAAGGANFPDAPPWEGGKKTFYDPIFVLLPGQTAWKAVGRLPVPRAYGATLTVPGGVLIAGGENADQVFNDTLMLTWDGQQVQIRPGPPLPEPVTSAVAVLLEGSVYLAGGYAAGTPRFSRNFFWRLNLADSAPQWQTLPVVPGPTRALAVAAAAGGAVYVLSGIEVSPAAGKTPPEAAPPVYLTDAYRYRPGAAWERLPDLPWSAIAAPSPAPVTEKPARVFVLGGVDGRQVGHLPKATVLPDDILVFDAARNAWSLWPEAWPKPVVCIHTIETNAGWILPSGETMAGKRTTDVWTWRAGE